MSKSLNKKTDIYNAPVTYQIASSMEMKTAEDNHREAISTRVQGKLLHLYS